MSVVTKQLAKEQQFGSTKEIMEAIKGMFQDVLQEAMEAELEAQITHERYEKTIPIIVKMGILLTINRIRIPICTIF